jgi:hypothetical protein
MRRVFTSTISFLLYSNVIITVVAGLMTFRSFRLGGFTPDLRIIGLIMAATMVVYAVHSLAPDDRPGEARDRWNSRYRIFHRLCLTVSVIVFVSLFFQSGISIFTLIPAGLMTAYYMTSRLLHLRLYGKTILLALTWAYTTMVMPLFVAGKSEAVIILLPVIIAELAYIYLICLFFDHRDEASDTHRTSLLPFRRNIQISIAITVCVFIIGWLWAWHMGLSHEWLSTKAVLMLILLATSKYSLKTRSDLWYIGVLDGMMALDIVGLHL